MQRFELFLYDGAVLPINDPSKKGDGMVGPCGADGRQVVLQPGIQGFHDRGAVVG